MYKTPPLHGFVNFWPELQLVTIYQHYRKEHHKSNEVLLNIRVNTWQLEILVTTLPLALHYIEVSLSFTIIHLHPSSFNVIHLHPFSFTFIHLSTFIHFHPLLSNLIHFHRLPSSTLIEWLQKISIPPRPLKPLWKIIGNSEGEGGSWKTSFPKGDEPTINLKHKNILTCSCFETKVSTPSQ